MTGLSEAFERTGSVLEHRMPLMHAPGAALAVTDDDETLGVVVRGFADAASSAAVRPETRFEIGSISKSFAAIVAVQEAETGRLDLQAPVNELVPWLRLRQPFGPITLHHLLTHSAGLAIGTEHTGEAVSASRRRAEVDPGFAPGERFSYSNDGYKIVGLVLEHTTGTPIADLLRQRILEPLGMARTSPTITPEERLDLATGYASVFDDRPTHREHPLVPAAWTDSTTADGSIISTVLDMGAYARMLIRRGAGPDGTRILSEEAFHRLTTPYVLDQDDPSWHYAYGFWVGTDPADGRRYIWHSGGMVGFTALLMVDVDADLGGVMLVNGDGDRRAVLGFALAAVRAAVSGAPLPDPADTPDPLRIEKAEEYVGRYTGLHRTIEIAESHGGLTLRDGDREIPLEVDTTQVPTDAFLVPHPGLDRFYLRFCRDADADGAVVAATHGANRFERGEVAPIDPPLPQEWTAFPGHYRSTNPWNPSLRVVAREGKLWLIAAGVGINGELELRPDGDDGFVAGLEPWRTERVWFDVVIEGRAARMHFDGAPYHRSFMP
ncbi:MAG: serine hydrolase domain-containing protein [Actinomycetota bacterium]